MLEKLREGRIGNSWLGRKVKMDAGASKSGWCMCGMGRTRITPVWMGSTTKKPFSRTTALGCASTL